MIITSTPTSLRRPGAYSEFKFLAAGQALVPVPLRLVIVAEKSAAGTAAIETPIQIFDEDDADAKSGKGSFGALMARCALAQAKLQNGLTPEIWLCPIAESAGVATQNTITITGPATANGNLVITACGRTVITPVSTGDTATTIAAALKLQLDAMKGILPFTAGVAAGLITTTNVTKGVNGNDTNFATVTPVAGVTVVYAQSVAGTGACSITNAVNNLYDQRYHAVAVSNHTTTDIATLLTARADAWSYNQKNWRFFFMGERGTLGTAQTLAAAANDFGIIVGSCEQTPSLSCEIAVAKATAEFGQEAPNANTDGQRLALYPPSGAFAYTVAEIESALSSGVTPLSPDGLFNCKIERLVTTQTTLNAAPFEPLRDIAYPRTAAYHAEQVEIGYRTGFVREPATDSVKDRVRNMIVGIDRAMEQLGYIRDVDDFLDQIQVELASSPAGRFNASTPFRVVSPLHQVVVVNNMYM